MEYTVLLIVAGDGSRVGAVLLGPAERDTSIDKKDDVSYETQKRSQLGDGHLDIGTNQQMTAAVHSFLLLTSSTKHFEELVRQLTGVSFFPLLWFSLLSSRSTVLSDNILPTCHRAHPLSKLLLAAVTVPSGVQFRSLNTKARGTRNLCSKAGRVSSPPPSAEPSDPELLGQL
jgi:hypothetical protein